MQSCTVYNCRYTNTFNDDNGTLISCANTGAGPCPDGRTPHQGRCNF